MQEITIVFLGHQDHGKSTLIGRLVLDTNSIKKEKVKEIKEIDKNLGKEFELAHLIDSFKEEREQEMTIDSARMILKGRKKNYQLIDVPGHLELISNMLTGASNAKAAILVVSIEEGIKEQTINHLEIAKLLGIEELGVAINKMDKVDYQKEKFEKLLKELKEILEKIGYISKKIHFFPVSAKKGDNVVKKSKKTSWYSGITIMEFLEDEIEASQSLENLPLKFLVQDIYEKAIIGKIESGKIKKGDGVLILPQNKKSKIKAIFDGEKEIKKAEAPESVGIILEENLGVKRGAVICSLDSKLKIANNLAGEVFWIRKPSQRELILECGTARVEGKLSNLEKIDEGKKTNYKILLKEPIVVDLRGKTILSKLVFKDKGEIIAVGNIL